jgi:hypothetical protein
MPIPIHCPACHYCTKIADRHAGQKLRCPQCRAVVAVPLLHEVETVAFVPVPAASPFANLAEGARRTRKERHSPFVWAIAAVALVCVLAGVIGAVLWAGRTGLEAPQAAANDAPALPLRQSVEQGQAEKTIRPPPVRKGNPGPPLPQSRQRVSCASYLQLYNDYANVVSADGKYLGKTVSFRMNRLPEKTWKEGDRYLVGYCTLFGFGGAGVIDVGIVCELSPEGAKRFAEASKPGGKFWRVEGVCKGARPAGTSTGYDVLLTDCSIVKD